MLPASELLKRAQKLAIDNSPTILTALGVTGTVTTAFLTGTATVKATRLIDYELSDDGSLFKDIPPTKQELFQLVYKEYIPAVGMLALSVTCIIAANRVGTRRAAAIATAYSLSEKAFVEYKEKVLEKMGAKDEQKLRDELAQDRIDRNPVGNTVVIVGDGDVLCFEAYTGRYFMSTVEKLKKAQNDVNYMVVNDMYASLSDFYDKVGLPRNDISDNVGWNCDQLMELELSTCLAEDGRPAISVTFHVAPVAGYARLH